MEDVVPAMRQRISARLERDLSDKEWIVSLAMIARRQIREGTLSEETVEAQIRQGTPWGGL